MPEYSMVLQNETSKSFRMRITASPVESIFPVPLSKNSEQQPKILFIPIVIPLPN